MRISIASSTALRRWKGDSEAAMRASATEPENQTIAAASALAVNAAFPYCRAATIPAAMETAARKRAKSAMYFAALATLFASDADCRPMLPRDPHCQGRGSLIE